MIKRIYCIDVTTLAVHPIVNFLRFSTFMLIELTLLIKLFRVDMYEKKYVYGIVTLPRNEKLHLSVMRLVTS